MKGDLDSVAAYLFNNGVNYRAYQALGCHKTEQGYRFGVWAPNARLVSLVGEFNNWEPSAHPMQLLDETGIWHVMLEDGIEEGTLYKYAVTTQQGDTFFRADPFGLRRRCGRGLPAGSILWRAMDGRTKTIWRSAAERYAAGAGEHL